MRGALGPSMRRRVRRFRPLLRRAVVGIFAFSVIAGVVVPPVSMASAATSTAVKASPAKTKVHPRPLFTRSERTPVRPNVCGLPSSPPSPSLDTIAYASIPSLNEVQPFQEDTGSLMGSPIPVRPDPTSIAYWHPKLQSNVDPQVISTDSSWGGVTFIDAETLSVIKSIAAGSDPTQIATSNNLPYGLVIDNGSTTDITIINIGTDATQGTIATGAPAGDLKDIVFSANGAWAYVSDPAQEKIFVIKFVGGATPFALQTGDTFSTGSLKINDMATDPSSPSSSTLILANDQTSSGSIISMSDTGGALSSSTETTLHTLSSTTPGYVNLETGSNQVWWDVNSSKTVGEYNIPGSSYSTYSAPSSFTAVGPMATSADGSTVIVADTGSTGAVQEFGSVSPFGNTNSLSIGGQIGGIAPAAATAGSWDAYVVVGNNIEVVNTATQSVTQIIPDAYTPKAIVASPDGNYIYIANEFGSGSNEGSISEISITNEDLSGYGFTTPVTVSEQTGQPGVEPYFTSIAINPQGTDLFVSDAWNGSVDVIPINSSGTPTSSVTYLGLQGTGVDDGHGSALTPFGVTVGPDGGYAYATESNGSSSDGVAVLDQTTAGSGTWQFETDQEDLSLHASGTLENEQDLSIDPSNEYAELEGTDTSGNVYLNSFKIVATGGELATTASASILLESGSSGSDALATSPEDSADFVGVNSGLSSRLYSMLGMPVPSSSYSPSSYTTGGTIEGLAVSPDGLYTAVSDNFDYCGTNYSSIELLNNIDGTEVSIPLNLTGSVSPAAIAFAPQSAAQSVSTSELAGGASNPAESAINGINDVVSSGTPSDAPGATAGVDTATGSYSLSLDSMDIPDVGIPLSQTATYDSSRVSTQGLLGYGWQTSYGITASQNAYNAATDPCWITLTQEGGSTVTFKPTDPPTYNSSCTQNSLGWSLNYAAPAWAQVTLAESACPSPNGSWTCFNIIRDTDEILFISDPTISGPSPNGDLLQEHDLNNNDVNISWGTAGGECPTATSTEPCQVTGAQLMSGGARSLTYSYPSPGTSPCPSTASSCVVVADPVGRTITYALNSSGEMVSATLSVTNDDVTQSAAYVFSYNSSKQMTAWWDPQNEASNPGSASFATEVTYSSAGEATQVVGPEVNNFPSGSTEDPGIGTVYNPTTSFNYANFNPSNGDGAVVIEDANYNQSPSMPGADITLDTYGAFELVSSVQGYGQLSDYGSSPLVPPTPSISGTPMRDRYNLMPDEDMNGLSMQDVGANLGMLDSGISFNSYDAYGNLLMTVDPSLEVTTSTYNSLNEVLTSTTAGNNTTTNSYNSTGQLLSTTSPAPNGNSGTTATSNWYDSAGLPCASRDAVETFVSGVLSSCVETGNHAETFAYDASGDLTYTTSSLGDVSQNVYDKDGDVCASLSPNGYVIDGPLSEATCPSAGDSYATVELNPNEFNDFTETVGSIDPTGSNYSYSYICTNENDDTTVTIGPMGSYSGCTGSGIDPSTNVDASAQLFDGEGNVLQAIGASPSPSTGVQGETTSSIVDPNGNTTIELSPQGFDVWEGTPSADLSPYETDTLIDTEGETAGATLGNDTSSAGGCEASTSSPCPDELAASYDSNGDAVTQTAPNPAGSTSGSGYEANMTENPNGTLATAQSDAESSPLIQYDVYNADMQQTETCLQVACTSTDPAPTYGSSTAFDQSGRSCWTSKTPVLNPTCSSIPGGAVATANYYNLDGNLIAQVGPGGAGTIEPGGTCNPMSAFGTYLTTLINTSSLCAFTTYYVYNEGEQLVETIQPSKSASTSSGVSVGATTAVNYDADGNQSTITNPAGNTQTNEYNADNEVIGVTYSDVTSTNCSVDSEAYDTCFAYNGDGTRAQMTDSSGTTTYGYNGIGELTSESWTNTTASVTNSVTYAYNAAGSVICISYPGFSSNCTTSGAGTDDPPAGDVTYSYDSQGRISDVIDWNEDAFLYGYDCAGNVAWTDEMSTSEFESLSPIAACSSASDAVPSAPEVPTGDTNILTTYGYSSGSAGDVLLSIATQSVTSSGSSPLLAFGGTTSSTELQYSPLGQLTESIPYVNGTEQTPDSFNFDPEGRVTLGSEAGAGTSLGDTYAYVSPTGGSGYHSSATSDGMGIAEVTNNTGDTNPVGSEYAGNGELCWAEPNPPTGTASCSDPGSSYEAFTYDASGDLIGTTNDGYGATSSLLWNQDSGTLSCANPGGSSCSSPSSTSPETANYSYNADGLRMDAATWNASTDTVETSYFTWDTQTSALLSNGTYDYIYGASSNVPIAQLDAGDSVTSELLTDTNSNVRGIVVVTGGATESYTLANYTDYDAYGNPITGNGGSTSGGLMVDGVSGDPDSATSFGFGGGFADGTGYVYLVNRYYDPSMGEFLSVDPDVRQTQTPYSYAQDNPIMQVDPLGLHDCTWYEPWTWGGCVLNAWDHLIHAAEMVIARYYVGQEREGLRQIQQAKIDYKHPARLRSNPLEAIAYYARKLRTPDYIQFDDTITGDVLSVGLQVTLTRYGGIFFAIEGGAAAAEGNSFYAVAGWIDRASVPSKKDINRFLYGASFTVIGYYPAFFGYAGPAAAEVYGLVGHTGWGSFATEIGVGFSSSPSLGLYFSYGFHVSDSGAVWGTHW